MSKAPHVNHLHASHYRTASKRLSEAGESAKLALKMPLWWKLQSFRWRGKPVKRFEFI